RAGGIEKADLGVRRETRDRGLPPFGRAGHQRREEQEAPVLAVGGAVHELRERVLGHDRAARCGMRAGVHTPEHRKERQREGGEGEGWMTWNGCTTTHGKLRGGAARSCTTAQRETIGTFPFTESSGEWGHGAASPPLSLLDQSRDPRLR